MSMRVHELAKRLDMEIKDLIAELKGFGVEVKSGLNAIDKETAAHVIELLSSPAKEEKEEEIILLPEVLPPVSIHEMSLTQERIVAISPSSTIGILAESLGIKANELISYLMKKGIRVTTINQSITPNIIQIVENIYKVQIDVKAPVLEIEEEDDNKLGQKLRPPVVTIMGHVDHGKTKLLDAIRETNVVDGESGGITQHIGAYKVHLPKGEVAFLDTPGHQAFTAMRSRGAQVTDIVVLVVAADDGVMPQTEEAIDHAKAAGVPILVAVNKIDLPDANSDKIKAQLSDYGLQPEEWGGKTIFVEVSAKKRIGLEHLLEMLLLEAEMLELRASYDCTATGTVIEARLDKGRGPVATVLVQKGTLRIGDAFVAGLSWGKVRAMFDDKGVRMKKATPSTPVEVLGFSGVPVAGDLFKVVSDEKEAKQIAIQRKDVLSFEKQPLVRITLDELYSQIQQGIIKELNVILKADVTGSLEVMCDLLGKIGTEKVKIKVIHKGIGDINESDVMLADASNAIIIGFHVGADTGTKRLAEEKEIDVRMYTIIYQLIEELTEALAGLLEVKYKEVIIGVAEIRDVFKASKIGVAAGSFIKEGKIQRNAIVRLKRDGNVISEAKVISLRRFKDDVTEVVAGFECGIGLEGINDIKTNDIIEAYILEKVKQTL
ncbi:translation initiation factor IF-2 [bacterium]|nr:translation initiation factor IF-2 [bacterium]MBU1752761.1 translation initiation factor IF-2 [bacterium]